MLEENLAWASLLRAPGLNRVRLSAALELLGSVHGLFAATAAAWDAAALPAITQAFLSSRAAAPLDSERQWSESPRHHLIPFTDARYPALLRSLPNCPIALYVTGCVEALSGPQLAIVGSRCPTPQGREIAFEFALRLSECGLGVASGLAEGIDACAHRGALRARGITLGIMGTGIDRVFPRCHRGLFEEIERHGALISEFPLGTPPLRGNFPRRNRVLAALSLGTLVVEAARRSGSLITAGLANDFGREVFAIPGSIQNPLSQGCHELIKGGAKLTESAADILRELNLSAFFTNDLRPATGAGETPPAAAGMDNDHKILLDALGFDPADLDTLVVRTGFKPEAVSSMMLILELEGHVQAAPGGRYALVANRRAGGER